MFLFNPCVCASSPKVIKVTDSLYVLQGFGSTTRLREKLIRRTGSDVPFTSRLSLNVNLTDSCSVLTADSVGFYLVPLYFTCISQARVVAFLDRIARLPQGRITALILTGGGNNRQLSEYLFFCSLVNFIRDKFPTQSVDSAAFDFLDSQSFHRSLFRMVDAVRVLSNSRLREQENIGSEISIVQLNHVIISGIPLDRATITLQLVPNVYGNSLVRYFDAGGNVSLTLQLRASESFLLSVAVAGVRVIVFEIVGLSLYANPFQVLGRSDLNAKVELQFPLPDTFTLTLVSEILNRSVPGNAVGVELRASEPEIPVQRSTPIVRSPRGDEEKRQLVLASLPEFPATRRETSDECQICMENFKHGEQLLAFPCLHHFHRHCVEEWTRVRLLCPNCRCDAFDLLQRARDA